MVRLTHEQLALIVAARDAIASACPILEGDQRAKHLGLHVDIGRHRLLLKLCWNADCGTRSVGIDIHLANPNLARDVGEWLLNELGIVPNDAKR